MRALARLPAAQGIAAMQSINVCAITPPFMAGLFGTGAACVVLAGSSLLRWSPGSGYVLAGSLLYVFGNVVVTIVFNVPRNDALAAADAESAGGPACGPRTSPAGRRGTTYERPPRWRRRRCS